VHTDTITTEEVKKIAKLANLKLPDNEAELFAGQFTKTIEVINKLNEIDTDHTIATYEVNGLSNVTRADEVNLSQVLPQGIALGTAKRTHQGFFVVNRLIDSDVEELI
jgi:aspartyl-tRNA(Asn)/glutamyl-tRNA(Gln) amidotransferase subunit C